MHDHYLLIVGVHDGIWGNTTARYSRCEAGLEPAKAFQKFEADVVADLPGHFLIAIVEDFPHAHPRVTTEDGPLANDDTAHMP